MNIKPVTRPNLLCRAHLHHRWIAAYTPDGERYMHCKYCGTDRTEFVNNGSDTTPRAPWFASFGG